MSNRRNFTTVCGTAQAQCGVAGAQCGTGTLPLLLLRVFDYLLPRAKAWSLTIGKNLRNFISGLTGTPIDIRAFFIDIYFDLFPTTTTQVPEWEAQFGILTGGTDAQKRAALTAAWRVPEFQSPKQIQDTLQAAGFNVFVHEWWSDLVPTPRDPRLFVDDQTTDGFVLVNKIPQVLPGGLTIVGNANFVIGGSKAIVGATSASLIFREKRFPIPDDPTKWPFFLYIGGAIFPNLAQVPAAREEEFETLCLKICPTEQWLGMRVEYV